MLVGSRVRVSAERCNIRLKGVPKPAVIPDEMRYTRRQFDFNQLQATYYLDMADPYMRAQALLLLHIIACHHTFLFSKFDHYVPSRRKSAAANNNNNPNASLGKKHVVPLHQVSSNEREKFFDAAQIKVFNNLKKLQHAASDFPTAIKLFAEIDTDGSGLCVNWCITSMSASDLSYLCVFV